MATYDRVGDLPLVIDAYRLGASRCRRRTTWATTVIHLEGAGHEGVGEDVTYSNEDYAALQAEGPRSRWREPTRSTASRSFSSAALPRSPA